MTDLPATIPETTPTPEQVDRDVRQKFASIENRIDDPLLPLWTPQHRVAFVTMVAQVVFRGADYETADLIREAMEPYQEANYED